MIRSAKWITSPRDAGAAAFTYSKCFALSKKIKKATLYASAMGVYAPYLNSRRVGDAVLAPGWTSYNKRILYQTYDITDMLSDNNRLEIGVGQGWAVGYLGYNDTNHIYADHVSLIAQIELIYADGTKERIVTDEDWEVYTTSNADLPSFSWKSVGIPRPLSRTEIELSSLMVTYMSLQYPANASSIELSTTSYTR